MTKPEQQIEVGQVWQHRKRDRRIVIDSYDERHDDCRVSTVGTGRSRRGAIFGSYLRRDYDLAPSASVVHHGTTPTTEQQP